MSNDRQIDLVKIYVNFGAIQVYLEIILQF